MKKLILALATSSFFSAFTPCINAQTISAGAVHSIVVCADGQAMVFGSNSYGQLGLGEGILAPTPTYLPGLTNVSAAAACGDHSIFIKSDGTVWCTGDNSYGQLGNGTTDNSFIPVQAIGITNAVAASGIYQSLILLDDGTVMAFGENGSGQCGVGLAGDVHTPTIIPGLNNVVEISAGYYYSLALKSDGTVWAWGSNTQGNLGIGLDVATTSNVPVQIETLSNIVDIDAGGAVAMALDNTGKVWVWGVNTYGQLGTGDGLDRPTPIIHPLLSDIVSVSSGGMFGVAIDANGNAKSWGRNWVGQLGSGDTDDHPTPVDVVGITNIERAIAGHDIHTLFVLNDGSIWACGAGDGGAGQAQFGSVSTPIPVDNLCSMVGTESIHEEIIGVFPNPIESFFRIEGETLGANFAIYNAVGQQQLKGTLNAKAEYINTSSWPSGVYMLQISNGQNSQIKKIIKN